MFVALRTKDNNEDKIGIENGIKGNIYYCPACGGELIVKRGQDKAPHFAHKHQCTDTWHYDMTAWHYEWQSQFPLINQEKVFTVGEKIHRADVFIGNTVIEFQHSSMSREEFDDRNTFYNQLGFKVVWVFDVRGKDITYLEDSYWGTSRLFSWKYPIRFLDTCDKNKKNVTVFLQIDDSIWNRQNDFYSITDFSKLDIKPNLIKIDEFIEGFSCFETKDYYSDVELIDAFLNKNYENKNWYDYKLKPNLLALCDHINNDSGLNYHMYGYCPKYKKDIHYCEECHGCYNYVPKYNGCNYRFKDLKTDSIKYIYSLVRDRYGVILETDLLVGNERKRKKMPPVLGYMRSIKDFVIANPNMKVARFSNMCGGTVVQLGFNNMKKLREQNICEGKLCGYNNYTTSERRIYDWNKSTWVMIWKKDVGDPYETKTTKSFSLDKIENTTVKGENNVSSICPKCGGMVL